MAESSNVAEEVLATARNLVLGGMSASEIHKAWRARKEGRTEHVALALRDLDDRHLRAAALAATWLARALSPPRASSTGAVATMWAESIGGHFMSYIGVKVNDAQLAGLAAMGRFRRLDLANDGLHEAIQTTIKLGVPAVVRSGRNAAFLSSFERPDAGRPVYRQFDVFTGETQPIVLDPESIDELDLLSGSGFETAY